MASRLEDRVDGSGADPLLLAHHLAERPVDRELAIELLEEGAWRECGPAAVYRLARLME